MIRYRIARDELEQRIEARAPGWLQRAQQRTDALRQLGIYQEDSSIWSEIKEVYMQLQHNKCAYCERKLEGPPYGQIEHDLEHYRPKRKVKKWPPKHWPPKAMGKPQTLAYTFATGDAWDEGYYLLAYDIQNYATACKVCNSALKRNYFPIYGPRGQQSADCRTLAAEQPLLLYPVGDVDQDDPEELLSFNGIIPVPTAADGYAAYRAQVTIDFFALQRRDHLRHERAQQIEHIWFALQQAESGQTAELRTLAAQAIERLTSPANAHASCVRAFYQLYQRDRQAAAELYMAAVDLLKSLEL